MNPAEYWHYDLSEYAFRVRDLDFSWVLTWYGAPAILLVFGAVFFLSRKVLPHRLAGTRWSWLPMALDTAGIFAAFVFVALFTLWRLKIDWGLRWYGTMYVLCGIQLYIVFSYWIRTRKVMMTRDMLDSMVGYMFLGLILGARSFFVFIYNWDFYSRHKDKIIAVWEGGLSFHGGIVGVIAALVIFSRVKRIPFFHLTDKVVLTIPFGIAMGRIGNFFNGGELYGRVVSEGARVPWAVVFPQAGEQPRHPSQLYQSVMEGWLLLLTLFVISRWRTREGTLGAAFLFFYGLYRYPIEYFREPDRQLGFFFGGALTMGQLLSFAAMLAGAVVFALTRRNLLEHSPEWQTRQERFFATHGE